MGSRGIGAPKRWLIRGTPEFWELVNGPASPDDKNRIDVMRRRWMAGGEQAVMDWWEGRGERPWAWWRFTLPAYKRRQAERYATQLEALVALDLLDPGERIFLEDVGMIQS